MEFLVGSISYNTLALKAIELTLSKEASDWWKQYPYRNWPINKGTIGKWQAWLNGPEYLRTGFLWTSDGTSNHDIRKVSRKMAKSIHLDHISGERRMKVLAELNEE